MRALEPIDADLLYKWENNQVLWPVSFTQIPFSKFILEDFVNASHQDIYTNKQFVMETMNIELPTTTATNDGVAVASANKNGPTS